MSNEKLHSELELLISGISGLLSELQPTASTLQHYALVLAQSLGASKVELSLSLPQGQYLEGAFTSSAASIPFLSYSRPIRSQDATYGSMLVELVYPKLPASLMLNLLDAAFQYLTLFAEQQIAAEEHVRLLEEIAMLETTLTHRKRVTRAAGFIATTKGISETQARKLIHSQAIQTARNPVHVANDIINRHVGWVPSRKPVPGAPLLKSA